MVYYGGASQVRSAVSQDGRSWTRLPGWLTAGRDPMPLRRPEGWLLYTTQDEEHEGGRRSVVAPFARPDAQDWAPQDATWEPQLPALVDPHEWVFNGRLESPFVYERPGGFYLFICLRDRHDYRRALVFYSDTPDRLALPPIAALRSHAAEIVEDGERSWITSGGKPTRLAPDEVGSSMAELGRRAAP